MFTMLTAGTRRTISTVAAATVVALAGLTLDQGHLGALPEGSVEVGELTPVHLATMAAVTLPEVVITAARVDTAHRHAGTTRHDLLPALAAAAGKAVIDAADGKRTGSAPEAGVLLK
jgi:hypothetical protein